MLDVWTAVTFEYMFINTQVVQGTYSATTMFRNGLSQSIYATTTLTSAETWTLLVVYICNLDNRSNKKYDFDVIL